MNGIRKLVKYNAMIMDIHIVQWVYYNDPLLLIPLIFIMVMVETTSRCGMVGSWELLCVSDLGLVSRSESEEEVGINI